MNISQSGIDLLKHFEGCELEAYQDSVGVWTIGYGHTKDVEKGMKITQELAEHMLKEELPEYEGYVNEMVEVDLDQCQFDSLVCWVYNLGSGNLSSSTMLKKLNSGDYDLVPYEMKRWDKAGGKALLGLTRRRNAEALMFKGEDWTEYLDKEAD